MSPQVPELSLPYHSPTDISAAFDSFCDLRQYSCGAATVTLSQAPKQPFIPPCRPLMPTIPENFFRDLLQRKTLERIKWAIFVSVPIWFGYGFARNPDNLEWVKQVFPTAAADPQGHGGRDLPTLADALAQVTLEEKIDHALEELRKKKAAQQK